MLEIDKEGNRFWFDENEDYHREDGPAIELIDGSKYWYTKDQFHRLDGPAIEWGNGYVSWYIKGKEYIKEEFNAYITNLY